MHKSKFVSVLTGGLLAAGTAVAVAGTPSSAASAPAVTSAARTASVSVIRLVTGDTVSTRRVDGHTAVTVKTLATSGSAATWTSATVGGDAYVFPAAAHYYLGSVLDPSLFDVSSADPSAQTIPLDIAFSGARPSVPGFTTTSATSTSLHGYVTPAGSRAFGTALVAQWKRDIAAGRRAPTSLFGATHFARSGVTPPVHPNFPQVTLVIKAVDASGQNLPFGFAALINTDNGAKYNGFLLIRNGEARASVPLGNYSMIVEADDFDPVTFALSTSIVTVPDFAVTSAMQHETVDFAAATVTPTIHTPQPASLSTLTLEWLRTVPGGGLGFSFSFGQGDSVKIAPAPAPVHGQVDWETTWSLVDTPASGTPYRYDLAFLDEGAIPADQARAVSSSRLAESDTRFYTAGPPLTTYFGRSAFYPFDDFIFTELLPMSAPQQRIDYFAAPSSARWQDAYIANPTYDDPFQGFFSDEPRVHPAGSDEPIDWLHGPLAPGIPEPADGTTFYFCPGCRTRTDMQIFFAPIVDTTPGHAGSIDAPDQTTTVANFSLYRNGHLIASEPNSTGDSFPVPAGNATYRAVEETFLGLVGFARSTHAVTELTFPSAAGAGGPAPTGWICGSASCTVLPLLTATVPLPTDLTGTMPLGANTFTVTIDPMRGAPARTVGTAALAISVDGGATYRPERVTALGHNRFRITIVHPSSDAGASVSLRVSGSDSSGDAITETVDDAYVVATS